MSSIEEFAKLVLAMIIAPLIGGDTSDGDGWLQ